MDELKLTDFEKGYLTAFYHTEEDIQNDHSERDESNLWYGVGIGKRVFDLCICKDEGEIVCVVYECFLDDDGQWQTDTSKQWMELN